MRKRWYIGVKGTERVAFASGQTPTAATTPYMAVIGPFRTKRATKWVENNGYNAQYQDVNMAERLAVADVVIKERKVYVLMWHEDTNKLDPRAGDKFATATVKRTALRHAKRLRADVYAIPYPGSGWDCPTIRAVFTPIYRPTA